MAPKIVVAGVRKWDAARTLPTPARARLALLGLVFALAACGDDVPDPKPASVADDADDSPDTGTSKVDAGRVSEHRLDGGDASVTGARLTPMQIEALGEPTDSACRTLAIEPGLERGGCRVLGPYAGIIDGSKGAESTHLTAALDECIADPSCLGVSTDWFDGSKPWYPVRPARAFVEDTVSYGCSLVLDCHPP